MEMLPDTFHANQKEQNARGGCLLVVAIRPMHLHQSVPRVVGKLVLPVERHVPRRVVRHRVGRAQFLLSAPYPNSEPTQRHLRYLFLKRLTPEPQDLFP